MKKFLLCLLTLLFPSILLGTTYNKTIMIGDDFSLSYTGYTTNRGASFTTYTAGYATINYSVSNESIVSVTKTSKADNSSSSRSRTDYYINVVATAIGTVTLTVQKKYAKPKSVSGSLSQTLEYSYSTDTYIINVVDVTEISMPSTLSLYKGDTYKFSPIIAQPGATTTLTWQSSNTSVATIDQNGNMSATGIGKTIIMCTAHNGVSASCEVTVNPIMVSSIALNQTEAEMCVGDKLQLSATVLPVNATTPAVAWTSSDESVAIVDENGQVTALKSGDVRITATATDGSGKSANCSVQVVRDNKLTANNITMCQAGKGTMHILLTQEDDISGFQFDLILPEGITVAENAGGQLLAALTNRASSHSISADKVSEGLYRFIVVSLSGKAITQGEGDVMTITLQADNDIAVGEYNVTMKEIELTVKNGITYSQVYPRDNTARLTVTDLMPGDVNGDGKVSVTDVISIISYILEEEPVQFIKSAADLNSDDKVSVTDAIGVIDIILNNK